MSRPRPPWLLPLLAGLSIALVFIALNYRAYDGFFQDDEFDTLQWAPRIHASEFAASFVSPFFNTANFRPSGHLYFAVMGRLFGESFPPWMTPLFALHLINGLLIFALARRMSVGLWQALGASAFFLWSAGALDAWWKPMYVFDLLCATFSLASILLYSHRRWVLSFAAFWLAYKAKEMAVMLPVALIAWEHWLGGRRYLRVLPFALVSLSFGLQGLLRNPNPDNDYTFRFTWHALAATVPFYARRVFLFRGSALLLAPLLLIRDRAIRWGLTSAVGFVFIMLFLPGRLYEAYIYLPFACVALALGAVASRVRPVWAWLALLCWMPLNVRALHKEQGAKLIADDEIFAFVDPLNRWAAQNRAVRTFVYDGVPPGFHHWGVTGAWNIAHHSLGSPAYYIDSPDAKKALANGVVAYGAWDATANRLTVRLRSPGQ